MAAVSFSFLLCYCANQVTKGLFRAKVIFNLVPANEAGQANLFKDKRIWWIGRHLWIPCIKGVFFRHIHFISESAKRMIAKFCLIIGFLFGSNSVLREDHCNNLHQWLPSVWLTFFWFRLEFCYGQVTQQVFVRVFLKLNKVSIDCNFFVFIFLREAVEKHSTTVS